MLLSKLYKGGTQKYKLYKGSSLLFDNTPALTGLTPILTSFSVENSTPTRVNFSTPLGYPDGMTITGFVISGKTISSVTKVNDTSGYFTVSSAFTWWEKAVTIRLESGDGTIYDFTLQRVTNNMTEVTTTNFKYITTTGTGTGNTIGDPMGISSLSSVAADTTVYIKAGNYGSQSITMANAGGATTPIKIIGYKTTPGDAGTLTRSKTTTFDSAEMPYITGSGTNLYLSDYTIVKNIQIENSTRVDGNFAFRFENASYVIFENCYGEGGQDTFTGRGIATSQRNAMIGCYVRNAGQQGSWMAGKYNFIDDQYTCSTDFGAMDYAVAFHGGSDTEGGNNVIINSSIYAHYTEGSGSSDISHGFSLKGANRTDLTPQDLKYTLIENCIADHVDQTFQFRHHTVGYNVARNCQSIGTDRTISQVQGMVFREASHNNTIENHYSEEVYTGVYFNANAGEGATGDQAGGHYNKMINCIWNGVRQLTLAYQTGGTTMLPSTFNQWINCTFNDMQYFVNTSIDIPSSNTVKNSILTSCPTFSSNANGQLVFDYNLFYTSFTRGTNTATSNPLLDINYKPTATYGADLQAPRITGVYYDKDGNERDTTTTRGAVSHADEELTPDTTAPTLTSITIENASPTNVIMVFDEAVTGTNLGFTIAGTTSTTFASISGSGTTWTGILGVAASSGQTITLSYNSAVGDFADTSSNILASITNQSVTNNISSGIIDIYPTGNSASAGAGEANSVANYTLSNGTRGSLASSTTDPYDGIYSIYTKCIQSAIGNVNILSDNITVISGHTYRVKFWYKTNYTTVDSGQYVDVWVGVVTSPSEALTATIWTEKIYDVVANSTSLQLRFYPARANAVLNGELYIDNITIEDIT